MVDIIRHGEMKGRGCSADFYVIVTDMSGVDCSVTVSIHMDMNMNMNMNMNSKVVVLTDWLPRRLRFHARDLGQTMSVAKVV